MITTLQVEGIGQLPLFLNPDDASLTPEMWAGRLWEATETRWFTESLRPGDVVVDVGANVGYYTVIAALLVGDKGRVYAFEPDPVGFEILQRNVTLNGLNNVILEQKAVAREAGTLRLFLAEENKGDHRIYQPAGEDRPAIEIEAVQLDEYLSARETSIDFLKVDTQGAELAILEGASATIRASSDLVMAVEYSPRHLASFGEAEGALIDFLDGLDMPMFNLGIGGSSSHVVRRISPEALRQMSPESPFFTNLLLTRKKRADVISAIRDARAGVEETD